ncbi:MAG: TolC family protein [Ginsengibacter sp.]
MIRTVVSNKYFRPVFFQLVSCLIFAKSFAQPILIDSAYKWAGENYPLIKKADLISQSEAYSLSNLAKGYLPQLNAYGQATYQSAVTSISGVANLPIEPLSKDQYKAYLDVSQTLYDGGVIKSGQQIQKASSALEVANLRKDLYDIKERINQLFFGALLLQIQTDQNNILIKQLTDTKIRVDSAVQNGAAFKSDAEQLQSEILAQQQRSYDLQSTLTSYLQMLEAFTGRKIDTVSELSMPAKTDVWLTSRNNRPELKIFDMQNQLYDQQINLLKSKVRPKLSLFGQGGYGKPGFNVLKNQFDWFYIGGVRLNWSFSSLYTLKNERKNLEIKKQETGVNRETFLFNNNLAQLQQDNEKRKTDKLIATDEEIIKLKQSISQSAKSKYENGVITLNDFLKEINALSQAQLNLALHKIQSISNQYNRKITLGN